MSTDYLAAYRRATDNAERASIDASRYADARSLAVLGAYGAGIGPTQLARELGVGRSRINQLLDRARELIRDGRLDNLVPYLSIDLPSGGLAEYRQQPRTNNNNTGEQAMTTHTTIDVLDPNYDDGSMITVDLADPPDWLDLNALHAEAGQAGDLELCRMIEKVGRS